MTKIKVAAVVGSINSDSLNRKLMKALIAMAPDNFEVKELSIDMALYSTDRENAEWPEEAKNFKNGIKEADVVLFATPEYNRSIPGSLKNAIDWASRPYGDNSFKGKLAVVTGATGGSLGTALAQYHLKQIMNYLDTRVLGQPEFYAGNAPSKFDDKDNLTDETTKGAIGKLWKAIEDNCK